jgi:hypothetical protein
MSDYADRAGGSDHNPIWADIAHGFARRYERYLNCPLPESLIQLLRKLDPVQPEGASPGQVEFAPSGPARDPDAASEGP